MSRATPLERLMLDLINADRARSGLDPLRLELRLNDSSEAHSDWMLRQDVFSHTGAGGSNAGERMRDAGFEFAGSWTWGENIALQSERGRSGLEDDVADLHRSLMNSPGHRANLLNPAFEGRGHRRRAGRVPRLRRRDRHAELRPQRRADALRRRLRSRT